MSRIKFWMLSIFVVSLLITSCGKSTDETVMLVDFLESVDSPINTTKIAEYIVAKDLQPLLATNAAYVIDIRDQTTFDAGHIKGAVRIDEKSVISHLDGMDVSGYDKVVIVCKTGQTAAFVSSLARLADYDAYSLKWGMSSWNEATDELTTASKNTYATEMVTEETAKGDEGSLPALSTGYETAQEILDARIAEVAAIGFGESAITADKVFDKPGNYYIVNFWKYDHYKLNHIPGAVQYTPYDDVQSGAGLETLPTDKTIVVYCYTGQTSSYMTAYLKVLGYDALSLKFGVNGFATDWLTDNALTHWSAEDYIAGYPLD